MMLAGSGEDNTTAGQASTQTASPASSNKGHSPPIGKYAKVYKFFGFNKGYNFPLWVIFAGAMFGFSLSRLQSLDFDGHFRDVFALVPGYWYVFHEGHFRYGMIIHLATILPAGILVTLQVTPVIRHKWILFHRINGYVVSFLALFSNFAVFVVIWHNQGGGQRIAAQTAEYFLGILTTIGIVMAIINIRRKQIDQHRAWMLRTWFWMGVIISARLLSLAATPIISRVGNWWGVWSCDEIDFQYTNLGLPFPAEGYPQCILPDGSVDSERRVAVEANEHSDLYPEVGLSITMPFGTILWICLALHTIGVELYLAMTPRESERLRKVSYEKQLEAGFRRPGSSGLPPDRWGDAEPWAPSREK